MKSTRTFAALLVAVCFAAAAFSHHASVGIDRTKTVTVEGVIKEFRWGNPHSWIEMEVVNSAGRPELWNLEMLPPSYLIPAGWTRSTVKVGDRVKVTANGFTDGSPGGLFVSITLPGGKTLGQRGGGGGGAAGARGQ